MNLLRRNKEESEETKEKIEELKLEDNSKENKNIKLKNVNKELLSKLKDLELESKEYQSKIKLLEENLIQKENEAKKLEKNNDKIQAKLKENEENLLEIEEELKKFKDSELKNDIKDGEKLEKNKFLDVLSKSFGKGKNNEKLQEYSIKLDKLRQNNNKLEGEKKELEISNENLSENLEKQKSSYENSIEKLRICNQNLEKELEESKLIQNDLKLKIDNLELSVLTSKNQINEDKILIEKYEAKLVERESFINSLKTNHMLENLKGGKYDDIGLIIKIKLFYIFYFIEQINLLLNEFDNENPFIKQLSQGLTILLDSKLYFN